VAESGSLQASSEMTICEAVMVKPKLQWRIQDVRNARKMECVLRNATRLREATWAGNSKAI
jgi:hypothetical protein